MGQQRGWLNSAAHSSRLEAGVHISFCSAPRDNLASAQGERSTSMVRSLEERLPDRGSAAGLRSDSGRPTGAESRETRQAGCWGRKVYATSYRARVQQFRLRMGLGALYNLPVYVEKSVVTDEAIVLTRRDAARRDSHAVRRFCSVWRGPCLLIRSERV